MSKFKDIKEKVCDIFTDKVFPSIVLFLFDRYESTHMFKRPKYPVSWFSLDSSIKKVEYEKVTDSNTFWYENFEKYYVKNGDTYTPVTWNGLITKEYFDANEDSLYTQNISYKDVPFLFDIKNKILTKIAWKHLLYWQKHYRFNCKDNVFTKKDDYFPDYTNWPYARMMQIINRHILPIRGYISGYTEPASINFFMEDTLTSFAVYCFYFGHSTNNKAMIRKSWVLRKELKKIDSFDDLYKYDFMKRLQDKFGGYYRKANDYWKVNDVDMLDNSSYWVKVVAKPGKNLMPTEIYDEYTFENTERFTYEKIDPDFAKQLEDYYKILSKEYYSTIAEKEKELTAKVFALVGNTIPSLWD